MHPGRRHSLHTPSDDSSSEGMLTKARPLQTVFRISIPQKQKLPVYHTRRSHNKSRAGCLNCKERRVKCDERRPHCQRCQRRDVPCRYSSSPNPSHCERFVDGTSVSSSDPAIMSYPLESVMKRIGDTLSLDSKWNQFGSRGQDYARSISTMSFQHFLHYSTETVADPAIRDVMKTDVIRVSFTSSHLMYTIIAVGMLHLNRLSPSEERSFAESYFWQHAIQQYQEALSMSLSEHNVDGLLSTCMLMGVVTVCPERFEPTDSWVLTNRPEAMNWLCLQSGLRCILSLADPYLSNSIWAAAFKETNKEERKLYGQEIQKGREGLNSDLADLCQINDSTTKRTSSYYSPLRILSKLLTLEKTGHNAAQCASFMGRLECDFITLLRNRDPPALIIMAHWMGLMCLLSQWQPWVEGRIRGECVAICMFLEHSSDPRILRLLRFPADSCGYKLCVF